MRTRERPLLPPPPPPQTFLPAPLVLDGGGAARLGTTPWRARCQGSSPLARCPPQSHHFSRLTRRGVSSRVFACLRVSARSYLSARNIPYLNLMSLDNLNCRDILRAKKVVVSQSAMAALKERYGAD